MKRKVIAITGFIGSGKSTASAILRQWGYKTVDCDQLAAEISQQPQVVQQVQNLLGEGYVTDGKLDRRKIRDKVFADAQLLQRYQSLFFDGVHSRLQQIASQCDGPLFVEIAVLGAFDFCWDEVWQIQSDRDALVFRVVNRDGVTENNVLDVLARQSDVAAPTRIILNNGTEAELRAQLRRALAEADLL